MYEAIFIGLFVLLLALCGAIKLWYGTHRMKRREKNAGGHADGDYDVPRGFEP
jgi:hypothetical protein